MDLCALHSFSPVGLASGIGSPVGFSSCGDELILLYVRMCVHNGGLAVLVVDGVQGLVCLREDIPVKACRGVSVGASFDSLWLESMATLFCKGLRYYCLYLGEIPLVARDGRVLVWGWRLRLDCLLVDACRYSLFCTCSNCSIYAVRPS